MNGELMAAVRDIAGRVKASGGRALVVGGAVRDGLLGVAEVKDVDLEVYGLAPGRLEALIGERYAYDACGMSFGVLKLKGLDIDVSLPRRESKRGLGHRGFEIESDPFLPIAEASARRDFTINAMYRDPLTDELIDPWHGARDLERRVLRHVSPRFVEDPLRVLRGMQFVARFDLEPAPETVEVCRTVTPEGLAPERLFEEWSKLILKGVKISKGLAFLRACGWVRYYPELERLIGCAQAPEWHPEGDVWNHTCCCLDAFARHRTGTDDLIVGLAVLCHDFGKPFTSAFDPERGRIRSLGHDEAGVEPTLDFLRRLTNDAAILKAVPPLVRLHMRPFAMWKAKAGDGAIRRLAAEVGRIDRLVRVAAADDEGRPPFPSEPEPLKWLAAQAERLAVQASVPKPLLMGRDLVARGMKPSPVFKRILDAAYEAQLDGVFADREGAIAFLESGRFFDILRPKEKGG